MRYNVKVPIVHLWSKFGYNWSEPVRTGAIWKRLTKTLTDGRTDGRTDIQNLDRYVSPRTFIQATQEFGSLCVSTNIHSGDTRIWIAMCLHEHSFRRHKNRDCLATAADCDMPFHEFLLSSLMHLLILSLQKSDHQSLGHLIFCTRTSAQNLPKIRILHVCVQTLKQCLIYFL